MAVRQSEIGHQVVDHHVDRAAALRGAVPEPSMAPWRSGPEISPLRERTGVSQLGRKAPFFSVRRERIGDPAMQFTTEKIEQARNHIVQTEQRIARQRRRVEKMLVERHPADEAQAQLLIMEQSLLSMTRFLKNLERDLELGDISPRRRQSAKRIKAKVDGGESLPLEFPAAPKNHS
jgi:hypothetical protein